MLTNSDSMRLTVKDFEGVTAVITDPPYGVNLKSNCKRGVKGRSESYSIKGDKDQSCGEYVLGLARQAQVPVIAMFASPRLPWSGKFRNLIVWDKGGGTGFGGDTATCLRRTWELIQVENTIPMVGRPESVWRVSLNNAIYKDHPCAKPVGLIKKLITTFVNITNPLIFDPFMGSGPTGVACAELGIDFKGNEIDKTYFQTARLKIEEAGNNYQCRLF